MILICRPERQKRMTTFSKPSPRRTKHLSRRARRRAQEVTDLDYETVAADLARRDALDSSRDADPLTEAADALGISLATAKRHWAYARAWLLQDIRLDWEARKNSDLT